MRTRALPLELSMTQTPDSRLPAWLPGLTHSLLRAVTGLMFMQHGVQKLFGMFADPTRPPMGAPPPFSLFWVAGVLETFGGFLIVIGLFTRPAAFLLSGMTAVAYFLVHAPRGFFPVLNGGGLAILYCFVFLYLSAAGGGPFSVDRLIRQKE